MYRKFWIAKTYMRKNRITSFFLSLEQPMHIDVLLHGLQNYFFFVNDKLKSLFNL